MRLIKRIQEILDVWTEIDRHLKGFKAIEYASDDKHNIKFSIVYKNIIVLTTSLNIDDEITDEQFKVIIEEIQTSLEQTLMHLGNKKLRELKMC